MYSCTIYTYVYIYISVNYVYICIYTFVYYVYICMYIHPCTMCLHVRAYINIPKLNLPMVHGCTIYLIPVEIYRRMYIKTCISYGEKS